jgi:hypothetical protein
LEAPGDNHVKRRVGEVAELGMKAKRLPSATYDLYVIRKDPIDGEDIFKQQPVKVGTYSEDVLYGKEGSLRIAFKAELENLRAACDELARMEAASLEYAQQSTLTWARVGRLKAFLGKDPVITELVAELRTARYQFLRRETPGDFFRGLGIALRLVTESRRWDADLVDAFVEALESVGHDSLAVDALRTGDGACVP